MSAEAWGGIDPAERFPLGKPNPFQRPARAAAEVAMDATLEALGAALQTAPMADPAEGAVFPDRRAGVERRQLDKARAIADEREKLETENDARSLAKVATTHPDGTRTRRWKDAQ